MTVLGFRVEHCRTSWQKFRGLMLRRELKHALLFEFRDESRLGASIHSFFVLFPFDAVWLNKKNVVVDARTVKPWTPNATPAKPAKRLLELPAGTIRKRKIRLGATLRL